MSDQLPLPPGQYEIEKFPRFGLTKFADRFPKHEATCVTLAGETEKVDFKADDFARLDRVTQVSDFHCVTTWTMRTQRWGGYRFADFYENLVVPNLYNPQAVNHVLLRGQDGYRTSMLLEDLLAPDVLLADTLNDKPLTLSHGAPLRLVAPAHYGYKSVKHISRISFHEREPDFQRAAFKFMDHPRARVQFEERGLYFPGWFLRRMYRPLVDSTIQLFDKARAKFESNTNK